jgi:predicted permease
MESRRVLWHLVWFEDLGRDVRVGLRGIRRAPIVSAVAVLTLALGIGANAAIFSILNGVLLRPLRLPRASQLVYVASQFPDSSVSENSLSVAEYQEFRDLNQSFASVGAYATGVGGFTTGEVNLTAGSRPLRARSLAVDARLLTTLGVSPEQGRLFTDAETALGVGPLAPAVVLVSHELWQSAFGGAPLVGRTIVVEGRSHEVVGIMPAGFDVMNNRTQIWLPLGVPPAIRENRRLHALHVIGRLKGDMTVATARTELSALLKNWGDRVGANGHVPTSRPTRDGDHGVRVEALQDAAVGNARRTIWVLQVAVGFVLLIACANLANLIMARTERRRVEFAVRAGLGASQGRLVRQTITEGLLLSLGGALLGVFVAHIAVQSLIRLYPTSLPRTNDLSVDLPVLLFALAASIGAGVFFGLASLTQVRARRLVSALKESGRGGSSRHHMRRALVTAEVALAVMLVIGAALLVRTVANLTAVNAGFNRSQLVTFSMTLPQATSEPETRARAYQRILDKLRAEPGVQRATVMSGLPPDRPPQRIRTVVENYINQDGQPLATVDYYQLVMSDYFETMNIPVVRGRAFASSDLASEGTVVVNETLAKTLWNGQDPVGRRVRPNLSAALGGGGAPWHTVIGVVKDVKQDGVDRAAHGELYVFIDQHASALPTMNVVIRTILEPAALSSTLERTVREVDPQVPVVRLRSMDEVFAESIARPRLVAQLVGAFAALALLLVTVGTYALLSYMVTERVREIGVRIALGAERSTVLAQVMKQGLQLTATGAILGVAGAFVLNRTISSLLFGVEPTDVATMAAVVAIILFVGALACWVPAWRASRLDPIIALRAD